MADHVDANPFFGYSLYLPRLLGAIPFDSAFQMKPSVLAYSCSVYSVLIGIAVYAIASLDKGYYRKSFDVVMDVCECLIVNCMAVSLWAGCARARAAVQKISFQWSALEVSFWGRISWNLFGLLTVCLETPLQMRAFSCENLGDFAYVLTLVVPYLYVNLANSVFHASCLLIEAQYSDLRRLLCTKHPYPIVLDGLVRRHALLCDQADSLGRAFSFSFLVLTAGIFVVSVCNIFFLIQRSNVLSQGQVLWEGQLMLVVWVLMWLSEQVMLARTCSRLVDQSKDFNTALFEMAMKDRTNQLARNEKLKLHIAMRREVNFSACGLFPIDYSLIHSMAAAATTYLVILVQFDQL